MAFEVLGRVDPGADRRLIKLPQDGRARGPRALEVRADVVDLDEVAVDDPGVVVRLPRELRLPTHSQRAGVAARRRQVDPCAAADVELGVRDRTALLVARRAVLYEPERALEPLDRRPRVLVADERDDSLGHLRWRGRRTAAGRRRERSPTLRRSA